MIFGDDDEALMESLKIREKLKEVVMLVDWELGNFYKLLWQANASPNDA